MSQKREIESRQILAMLELMDRFTRIRELGSRFNAKGRPISALPEEANRKRGLWKRLRDRQKKRMRGSVAAPRFNFDAKVLLQKNNRYIKGRTVDISRSGLFVAAECGVFREHEKVRVNITPAGSSKVYKTVAEVIRYEAGNGKLKGYGLKFFTWPGIPAKTII